MKDYHVTEPTDTDLVSRYEDLRTCVLDRARRPCCGGRSLVVFIRRGMAAWMELWNTKRLDDDQTRAEELAAAGNVCSGSPRWQSQLVDILTDLATGLYSSRTSRFRKHSVCSLRRSLGAAPPQVWSRSSAGKTSGSRDGV